MSKIFITFDPFYETDQYNEFLTAAKNNHIEYDEFISVRAPYYWYVEIELDDAPRFVNYDLLTSTQEKFIVNKMKARMPNEAYLLLRRKTDNPRDIERFISPKPLIQSRKESNVIVFKSMNKNNLLEISRKLGNTKIWKLGELKKKKYKIYMTFNPYVLSFISRDDVLIEKKNKNEYKGVGELEYELNHKVLVVEKIDEKTMELEYYREGKFYPLKAILPE